MMFSNSNMKLMDDFRDGVVDGALELDSTRSVFTKNATVQWIAVRLTSILRGSNTNDNSLFSSYRTEFKKLE